MTPVPFFYVNSSNLIHLALRERYIHTILLNVHVAHTHTCTCMHTHTTYSKALHSSSSSRVIEDRTDPMDMIQEISPLIFATHTSVHVHII